jgi:hypothetical protein
MPKYFSEKRGYLRGFPLNSVHGKGIIKLREREERNRKKAVPNISRRFSCGSQSDYAFLLLFKRIFRYANPLRGIF